MSLNPLFAIDAYKLGHRVQYPEGTSMIYSNFTPRSTKYLQQLQVEKARVDGIVVFGIQRMVQRMQEQWDEHFFSKNFGLVELEYTELVAPFMGLEPADVDVSHLRDLHDLGYLPIEVRALQEGTIVPAGTPVFTIHNTHPSAFWLVNYMETYLSAECWKPMTTATIAYSFRKLLEHYAKETGSPLAFVPWQGHDFSARGMSGMADNAAAGLGHLINFSGSDSVLAYVEAQKYYGSGVVGSVPATEHSVMCAGGQDNELETFRRLIEDIYPSGVVSIVSDTWNFFDVVKPNGLAEQLKEKILARAPNSLGLSKVVFRPDSGDPVDILCGTAPFVKGIKEGDVTYLFSQQQLEMSYGFDMGFNVCRDDKGNFFNIAVSLHSYRPYNIQYEAIATRIEPTPEQMGAVECLARVFGTDTNEAGFRVLNSKVGLIYGDSITIQRADKILHRLMEQGYAACNVVFGVGSYTYQYITRDTLGFAMKATYAVVNGEPRSIQKNPATDSGKRSATGLLFVGRDENGDIFVEQNVTQERCMSEENLLKAVFKGGSDFEEVEDFMTFEEIRQKLYNGAFYGTV